MVRDIDKLESVPDKSYAETDKVYLEKHKISCLLEDLLGQLLYEKPPDPLQYMIDFMSLGEEPARQDKDTGLSAHRKAKLVNVFQTIDKEGQGKISLRMLQNYANKYGGETLGLDELRSIFADFNPSADMQVGLPSFLTFFSKVSRLMTNADFDTMVEEMSRD